MLTIVNDPLYCACCELFSDINGGENWLNAFNASRGHMGIVSDAFKYERFFTGKTHITWATLPAFFRRHFFGCWYEMTCHLAMRNLLVCRHMSNVIKCHFSERWTSSVIEAATVIGLSSSTSRSTCVCVGACVCVSVFVCVRACVPVARAGVHLRVALFPIKMKKFDTFIYRRVALNI